MQLVSVATPGMLGIATHQIFKRKEPNLSISILVLSLTPILTVIIPRTVNWPTYFAFYYVSCTLSVIWYRLSPSHPLGSFPGPKLARISKLWAVWISAQGHQHLVFKELHDKYGPIVRVGPNEVSICDVDAVQVVLGTLPKGHFYDARRDPGKPSNLLGLTGEAHERRRRIWNRGMSTESLADYADLISKRALQLVDRLERLEGPVDLSAWLSYFSFDFMGDMAFGGGFEMMKDGGDKDRIWEMLNASLYALLVIAHVVWLSATLQRLPWMTVPIARLRKFGIDNATNRIQKGAKIKDLWYYLTDEAGHEKIKPSVPIVVADGSLAIIAGSDTTATALSSLFYLLLTHPDCMARVHQEVDSVYPSCANALDPRSHDRLTFLDACINEALRLYPPVPTNGPRRVPSGSGGKMIAGKLIPEGTEVYVPPYVLHRNPLYFSQPDMFLPNRWLESNTDRVAAFIPFSSGSANCAGKNLARQEMLMLSSLLLQQFAFKIARKEDFEDNTWGQALHDHFVATRGPLHVSLSKRHGEETVLGDT